MLDHVTHRLTDMRESQQRGTTEWVQAELDRTAEWVVRLRAEQQEEMQKEASAWLARELEAAPGVVMASFKETVMSWLGGGEGWVAALMAWVPILWGVGGVLGVGVGVVRGVLEVSRGYGGKGGRGRGGG